MNASIRISLFLRLALASLCICLTSFNAARAASIALDPTFSPPFFAAPSYGTRVTLLPDGSYVMNFSIDALNDQPAGAIIKFLADGTLDTSFKFTSDYDFVATAAALSDGRLIVAAEKYVYGMKEFAQHILRLNTDGSIDPTFNSADATTTLSANPSPYNFNVEVRTIVIQPDGKILLAGFFGAFGGSAHPGIARLLPDGTLDSGFAPITLQFDPGGPGHGLWAKPAIQTDGKILIAGDFNGLNGVAAPGVARLNSNGTLDGTFNANGFTRFSFNFPIRGVVVQTDGKIIVGGKFNVTGGAQGVPLLRLNSNGSLDPAYAHPTINFNRIRNLALQPDGKAVALSTSVYRFNIDGSLDSTFSQPVLLDTNNNLIPPEGFTLNLQSDGRILIGGLFNEVANPTGPALPRWSVARFNSDGTLDTTHATFHETAAKMNPTSFVRQFDGSTLIAAEFTTLPLAPAFPHSFGRLFADGSLDPTFDPLALLPESPATALGFVLLPDGNIFGFANSDDMSGFGYGVLLPDGRVADPNYDGDDSVVFSSAHPQADSRVLVSSSDAQSVIDNKQLKRIKTDGSLDSSFQLDPSILANTVQRDGFGVITNMGVGNKIVMVAPDDSILFSYLAVDSTFRLVRLTPDGAIDPTFAAATIPATTLPFLAETTSDGSDVPALQPLSLGFTDALPLTGGQIVVTGDFASYAGANAHGIVRLNANGTVDASFQAGGGAQWTQTTETSTQRPSIDNIELQNDGKFLITGTFEAFNGVAAPGIASLNANGSRFESLGRIASRTKFDNFGSRTVLARQPDGSFLLGGPYALPGQTESPSFIHIDSFGGVPIIGSPLIARGFVGLSFSYHTVASGQPTSYSATGLPNGLTIDPQTGVISGNATEVGTFTVDIAVTNAEGTVHGSLTLDILIPPPPVIISPLTASGTVGLPFSYQFEADNAASLAVTDLPAGLTFDPALRAIVGQPITEGTFQLGLSASNAGGTVNANLTLTLEPLPLAGPVIMSITSATGRTGRPFKFQVSTSGGTSASRISATGLPAGLNIDPVTGEISGTVTAAGSFLVTLTSTEAGNTNTATLQLTFTDDSAVPVIVSPNSAFLFPNLNFSYTITAPTSDPSDLITYSVVGQLPLGLGVNSTTGVISGVPLLTRASPPTPSLSGGIISNVQVFACNSKGCAAQSIFFLQPTGAANISTRLSVGTAADVLIGGFITQGNAPMQLVIRGIGPSLPVAGVLANPYLELYSGSATIASNDNWKDNLAGGSQETAIANSGLMPTNSFESAILGILDAGAYTAILQGNNNGTGVGLVEVYNVGAASMDVSSEAHLANISTRGKVQTGDNVMIGGFINQGSVPIKVLVRGIGPALTDFGVAGALANPVVELHKADGTIVINDNWKATQEAEIMATGLAPGDDLESAILLTLPVGVGAYTAIVSGAGGTTGVGLVEAYFGDPCLGASCP